MKNKKGLSSVVTTLIIILLVLVAIGIIWGVVNNLLNKSKGSIEAATKCLDVDIRALKVTNTSVDGDDYSVTLKRSASGDNVNFYAKIILYNANTNSPTKDFSSGLGPLDTKTETFNDTLVITATKIEVTPYYLDESGKEVLCPTTTSLEL